MLKAATMSFERNKLMCLEETVLLLTCSLYNEPVGVNNTVLNHTKTTFKQHKVHLTGSRKLRVRSSDFVSVSALRFFEGWRITVGVSRSIQKVAHETRQTRISVPEVTGKSASVEAPLTADT